MPLRLEGESTAELEGEAWAWRAELLRVRGTGECGTDEGGAGERLAGDLGGRREGDWERVGRRAGDWEGVTVVREGDWDRARIGRRAGEFERVGRRSY